MRPQVKFQACNAYKLREERRKKGGRRKGRKEETSIQITGLSILIIPRGYELIKLRQFIEYIYINKSKPRPTNVALSCSGYPYPTCILVNHVV